MVCLIVGLACAVVMSLLVMLGEFHDQGDNVQK
jgi:hypothetical protein